MARISVEKAGSINALAFLDVLAVSEIGQAMLANPETDNGYRVLVGSTPHALILFSSYSAHPHKLNRMLNSTAAGRYQIIYPTYAGLSGELGLHDFSPETQDRMALQLVFERGAMPYVVSGEIATALNMCRHEWASLPGAGALLPNGQKQHENRLRDLLAVYEESRKSYAI
jgi:muramidase (phage lysozyme)